MSSVTGDLHGAPQISFRADASRLALRFPAIGLGVLMVWAAGRLAFGSRHAIQPLVVAALAFGCLRLWATRTRLTLTPAGVELSMPLSTWHVPWAGVVSIGVTSILTPAHRGGVGSGVRLRLADGGSRSIPDVFAIRKDDLVRELGRRRLESARS